MSKAYKLVLSGSGTRYPCFIGAIKRLIEEGIEIEEVCGTSGGAIVSAGLGWKYDKENPLDSIKFLEEFALNLYPAELLDPHWFDFALSFKWRNLFHGYNFKPFNVFGKGDVFTLDPKQMFLTRNTNGIFKGDKILEKIRDSLPRDLKLKIPVTIVTFNNNWKQANYWRLKEDSEMLSLLVRASISLPLIFDPVEIDGDIHTDGGVTANFPLGVFGKDANVIGLTFTGIEPSRVEIDDKIAIAEANIDGAIMENQFEDETNAGPGARICRIETKHGGLNLKMDKVQIRDQINEGYDSVSKWLIKHKL